MYTQYEDDDWDAYKAARHAFVAETDLVHTQICLGPRSQRVMKTKAMKRLKNLKQLGASGSWCHGAEHTRFAHSRGVAHMAQRSVCSLHRRQPGLNLRPKDVDILELAGLVHDIGHGALSHAFQDMFMPRALARRNRLFEWEHENMSLRIIDHLGLETLVDLDKQDVQRIKDCVSGDRTSTDWTDQNQFLLDIVACKKHGADVDRMDYIARDALHCHQLHVPTKLGVALIDAMRVVEGTLCFDYGVRDAMQSLYKARADMHLSVYQHAKTRQAELMMMDALLLADQEMKIVETYVDDVESYLNLDDTILHEIKRMDSDSPWIQQAQILLNRLDAEDLYRMCGEATIPVEKHKHWAEVTEFDIVSRVRSSSVSLKKEDIVIQNVRASMGKKNINPITLVPFVKPCDPFRIFYEPENAARLVTHCEERLVRVFLRKQVPDSEREIYRIALYNALKDLFADRGIDESYVITDVSHQVMPAASTSRKRSRSDDEPVGWARVTMPSLTMPSLTMPSLTMPSLANGGVTASASQLSDEDDVGTQIPCSQLF